VSAGLNQPIPILIFWLTNKIIIGIDCIRSADINNDFLYQLATGDTKKTSFFIKKDDLPADIKDVFCSSAYR
jgi:hypothetical protein